MGEEKLIYITGKGARRSDDVGYYSISAPDDDNQTQISVTTRREPLGVCRLDNLFVACSSTATTLWFFLSPLQEEP